GAIRAGERPEDRAEEGGVQRVDLGDGALAPRPERERVEKRRGRAREPPADTGRSGGQLEREAREKEHARGAGESRDEIDSKRQRAERKKSRDTAEQDVEGIPGGMGDPERGGRDEEISGIFAEIAPRDGGRQGHHVDPKRREGDDPGDAAGVPEHAR